MGRNMRKVVSRLHLCLGLISGIVVFIVCITASLYVFRTEITRLLTSQMNIKITDIDNIFDFIIRGHQYIWLPVEYGRHLVGYSVLLFLISLITGIIMWRPRHWHWKKLRIKRSLKGHRFILQFHTLFAIYFIIPLILLCFTGLIYSFDWFRNIIYAEAYMDYVGNIHRGRFWGFIGQIIMFLASLIGASLPVTGYILWWKKKRLKAGYKHKRK